MNGDQVFIEGDPFVLAPNPAKCMATNAHGVPFRVAGGTGGHAGAKLPSAEYLFKNFHGP